MKMSAYTELIEFLSSQFPATVGNFELKTKIMQVQLEAWKAGKMSVLNGLKLTSREEDGSD